jgi:hypothetical protein
VGVVLVGVVVVVAAARVRNVRLATDPACTATVCAPAELSRVGATSADHVPAASPIEHRLATVRHCRVVLPLRNVTVPSSGRPAESTTRTWTVPVGCA